MNDDLATDSVHWEALERTLNETEVLFAIYGGDDESSDAPTSLSTSFAILSPDQQKVNQIKRKLGLLEEDDENDESPVECGVPDLKIEIRAQIESDFCESASNVTTILMRCLLPRGYPNMRPAVLTFLQSSPALPRKSTDEITRSLNDKAKDCLGTEAIMDMVDETKELILKHLEVQRQLQNSQQQAQVQAQPSNDDKTIGRRWIWVHHITKTDRISSILEEAKDHNLYGILKHGYPGVVLVEGLVKDCDAFVKWIKADKSSPHGGFGRNWGHHVRGEINQDKSSSKQHCGTLESTGDLSVMAEYCRNAGLEDEFKEYVLQHK